MSFDGPIQDCARFLNYLAAKWTSIINSQITRKAIPALTNMVTWEDFDTCLLIPAYHTFSRFNKSTSLSFIPTGTFFRLLHRTYGMYRFWANKECCGKHNQCSCSEESQNHVVEHFITVDHSFKINLSVLAVTPKFSAFTKMMGTEICPC